MINRGQIEITLLSDLLVSDGGGYNSLINQDICYDKEGFPVIPAKRMKGCLREAALELADWGCKLDIEGLFGRGGNAPGAVRISNARLKEYEAWHRELQTMNVRFTHPQVVLNQFTYIRTQTAIDPETGMAKEGLRSSRVIKQGCVFTADLTVEGDKEEIENCRKQLEMCCKAVKRMGSSRTRGLGEVRMRLALENTYEEAGTGGSEANGGCEGNWEETAQYRLEYTLRLHSPLIVKSAAGGQEHTLDYIPGSMMLGKIAGWVSRDNKNGYIELIRDGELKCANAYLCLNQMRMLPISAALFVIKNESSEGSDQTCIRELTEEEKNSGKQMKSPGVCYVDGNREADGTEKQVYRTGKVGCEMNYHHSRPKDKAIGRAWNKDDESRFYQLSSISAGQTFKGYVIGNGKQIKKIYACMKNNPRFRMGYNCSAEYGEVELETTPPVKLASPPVCPCSRFVVKLEAPLLEYDDYGAFTTDLTVLTKELERQLGGEVTLKARRTFYRYRTEGGFNRQWGARKPMTSAWDKGTTIVYEVQEGKTADIGRLQYYWAGERVYEGYGELSVYPASRIREKKVEKWEAGSCAQNQQEQTNRKAADQREEPAGTFRRQILSGFVKTYVEKLAREQAAADWQAIRSDKDAAIVSCLISMCRQYREKAQPEGMGMKDYLCGEIEYRYGDKKDVRKQKKYVRATSIIERFNSPELEKGFYDEYGCDYTGAPDEMANWYYMAYLTELKYRYRPQSKE